MQKWKNRVLGLGAMICAVLVSGVSVYAQGSGGVGNGGDGVIIKGKLKLLDFVEAGIEDSDLTSRVIKEWDSDKSLEKQSFYFYAGYAIDRLPFSSAVKKAVAAKLFSLKGQQSFRLFLPILMYRWKFTQAPLKNVGDEHTNIDTSKLKLVQVAIRYDSSILIHRKSFESMDLNNQVGLVFHEILYSMIKPVAPSPGTPVAQLSYFARQANADLFAWSTNFDRFEYGGVKLFDILKVGVRNGPNELLGEVEKVDVIGGYYVGASSLTHSPKVTIHTEGGSVQPYWMTVSLWQDWPAEVMRKILTDSWESLCDSYLKAGIFKAKFEVDLIQTRFAFDHLVLDDGSLQKYIKASDDTPIGGVQRSDRRFTFDSKESCVRGMEAQYGNLIYDLKSVYSIGNGKGYVRY